DIVFFAISRVYNHASHVEIAGGEMKDENGDSFIALIDQYGNVCNLPHELKKDKNNYYRWSDHPYRVYAIYRPHYDLLTLKK
ncbi:MAG: hypothetical protein V1870_03585, partial [Candidatus Aenigmatarchaeota archaeon]